MDDPFDSAHELEQTHIREGAADGRREGLSAGLSEGRQLGLQKGFEIGLEVGHYAGCVRAWRALQAAHPGLLPDKLQRSIAAMQDGLAAYPLYDPQDERLQDLLEGLRGKYKTVLAGLGKAQQEHAGSGGAGGSGVGGSGRPRQEEGLSY